MWKHGFMIVYVLNIQCTYRHQDCLLLCWDWHYAFNKLRIEKQIPFYKGTEFPRWLVAVPGAREEHCQTGLPDIGSRRKPDHWKHEGLAKRLDKNDGPRSRDHFSMHRFLPRQKTTPAQTPRPPPCATLSRVTTGTAENVSGGHSLLEPKWLAAVPMVHMTWGPIDVFNEKKYRLGMIRITWKFLVYTETWCYNFILYL